MARFPTGNSHGRISRKSRQEWSGMGPGSCLSARIDMRNPSTANWFGSCCTSKKSLQKRLHLEVALAYVYEALAQGGSLKKIGVSRPLVAGPPDRFDVPGCSSSSTDPQNFFPVGPGRLNESSLKWPRNLMNSQGEDIPKRVCFGCLPTDH